MVWHQAAEPKAPVESSGHFAPIITRRGTSTWKRRVSLGGGALRFYGIHLIALLAELGYETWRNLSHVADVEDEVSRWTAVMTGSALPEYTIYVDTNCGQELFAVRSHGACRLGQGLEIELGDPLSAAP